MGATGEGAYTEFREGFKGTRASGLTSPPPSYEEIIGDTSPRLSSSRRAPIRRPHVQGLTSHSSMSRRRKRSGRGKGKGKAGELKGRLVLGQ